MKKGEIIQYLWLGTGRILNMLDTLRHKVLLPFLSDYIMKIEHSDKDKFIGNARQRRVLRRAYERALKRQLQ
tara:strand:+ start:177 stop:392 length:216 start_codon:yes stop_codon:yes gene_type:complete